MSLSSVHRQPGGQPVEKADEQEVAGVQRAHWCLRIGWRGVGKTRPHEFSSRSTLEVPEPESFLVYSGYVHRKSRKIVSKTFVFYSLISVHRVVT